MAKLNLEEQLTYDDVLVELQYTDVDPYAPEVKTFLTKDIRLNMPIVSSPMDKVTGKDLCIAMAQNGGIGILHRNYTAEEQVAIIEEIKKHEGYIITKPITVTPEMTIGDVRKLIKEHNLPFNTFPVIDENEHLLGILTNTDYYLDPDSSFVKDRMSTTVETITPIDSKNREKVREQLREKKKKRLMVTDEQKTLFGLITGKDFVLRDKYPNATRDNQGRLMVGVAIGVGEKEIERAGMLYGANADLIVIDISHGHCKNEIDTIKAIKKDYPNLRLVAGNVATVQGVEDLFSAGADAMRIGFGAGSTCTTRIVLGHGVPQFHAVKVCSEKAHELGIYTMADGGIKQYGDMAKALAYADTVMLGNLLAGVQEAPGRKVLMNGRTYKEFRGMGSIGAAKERAGGALSRYEAQPQNFVAQGIDGVVDYKGPLENVLNDMVNAIKYSLATSGAKNLPEYREKAIINRVSRNSAAESHPSIMMTEQPPNYLGRS